MKFSHEIITVILSLIFLVTVLLCIARGRMRARYAIIWVFIGLLALFAPLLYNAAVFLHPRLDLPTPTTLLLIGAIFLLALVCIQFTLSLSRAWMERKNLSQAIAILEQRVRELESGRGKEKSS
jgi:hypothetical protein